MRLISYYDDGQVMLGVVTEAGVRVTGLNAMTFYAGGFQAYEGLQNMSLDEQPLINEDTLQLAPAVPNPGKIICVGLNYLAHAEETGDDAPDYPILFSKFNNALAAAGEDIPVAAEWDSIDYEAEMVAIIGKTAKNVTVDEALDTVLGYSVANDLSERALQFRSGQWLLGKTPDKFLPVGPHVVTADDVPDPQNLQIRGWLNDALRQDGHTSLMIFSVAEIVAYASQFMTLHAGDIISTGTPDGVILGYPQEERHYMQAGDTFTVEIEGIGRLSNTLVASETGE